MNFKSAKPVRFIKIGIGLVLALIVCLLIFKSCSTDNGKSNTVNTYGNYEVSAENPSIELSNPSSNDADFVFTVKDSKTQQLIGKTEKVPPGKFVYMNVMDFYKIPGVYNVDINISTYDSVTDVQLNLTA